MFKKIFFLSVTGFLSLILFPVSAQDTLWFNNSWEPTSKSKAVYFRPEPTQEGKYYRITDYYVNGVRQYEGYSLQKEDLKHEGVAIWFYPNGDTMSMSEYKSGILNGIAKTYYNSNQIHGIRFYKEGKLDSTLTEYYPNGLKSGFATYKNGALHGTFTKYYRNGNIHFTGEYRNGERDSVWVEYYYSGNLKSLYDYKDGIIEGRSHEFGDANGYSAKFTIQDGFAVQVEIKNKNTYKDRTDTRIMTKQGEREHWKLYSDSILIFEYFYEGLKRVGTWTMYSYDGDTIRETFTHKAETCKCENEILIHDTYGKDMTTGKVNATGIFLCYEHYCLSGEGYYTMKSGKVKKYIYKNGVEKPERTQSDLLSRIGSRFVIAELKKTDEYSREQKIDSLPIIVTDEYISENIRLNLYSAVFDGVSLKIFTCKNFSEDKKAWNNLIPNENEMYVFFDAENTQHVFVKTGNSLSLKLQKNLYDKRRFAAGIEQLLPDSYLRFQFVLNAIQEATKDINVENKYFSKEEALLAEKNEPIGNDKPIFTVVEQMPEFPGGQTALIKYLKESIRYPNVARDNDIQGKVLVKFVIFDDGRVGNIEVIKSVHPALDAEAIRIISEMPRWVPAQQRGKPVNCYFTTPFNFSL